MNWGTKSRDERDAAYNNSNAVKNSAELNAAREAASAAYRLEHPQHLDIPYGPRERNKWDLFPAADRNADKGCRNWGDPGLQEMKPRQIVVRQSFQTRIDPRAQKRPTQPAARQRKGQPRQGGRGALVVRPQ